MKHSRQDDRVHAGTAQKLVPLGRFRLGHESGDGAQDPIAPNSSPHLNFVLALVRPYTMSRSLPTILQLTAKRYVRVVARLADKRCAYGQEQAS